MKEHQDIPRASKAMDFSEILAFFPEIELPVTLSERDHHSFSINNKPLPGEVVESFFLPLEKMGTLDEFTEFIPCFAIPGTNEFGFQAIVYWKASLLHYTYYLATFTNQGVLIDKKPLAGISSDADVIRQSVASIEPDWMIYVAQGVQKENQPFIPEQSSGFQMELLADGRIVFPS